MSTFVDNAPLAFGDDDARRNLDAVRDLLFGSRNKEIDRRIAQLEDRLSASISAMEDRLNRQFDDLEKGLRREIGTTQERIEAERTQLEENDAVAGAEVHRLGDLLKDRFTEVDENLRRVESESRLLTLERSKALKDEFSDSVRDIREQWNCQIAELKQSSAPRGELGRRLIELGRVFSDDEPNPPRTETAS